jgi:Fur family ferric uptake transcriptional regulator
MSDQVATRKAPTPVTDVLRSAGLRVTPQRQLVVEVLRRAGVRHLTAEDVFREVSERYHGFNRSTVYRVLDLLTSAGVVSQHRLGGSVAHFELTGAGVHHHLICVDCQRVLDLDPAELRELSRRVQRRTGFAVGQVAVTIEGRCSACRGGVSG